MTGMNRTLEDGRPVLIDGLYPGALHIYGTLEPWTEEEMADQRAEVDALAREAFLEKICGEWALDIEKSREASNEDFIGEPTEPVTLIMETGGAFRVEAPAIGSGTMEIAVAAEGRIEVSPIIFNDRLQFELTVPSLTVTKGEVTIAGFEIPGLKEVIESFVQYFKAPQKVEIRRIDEQELLHIESDSHMLVLARGGAAPRDRNILPTPRPTDQRQMHLCWAAAISCFLRILRTANEQPTVVTPVPDPWLHDPHPEFKNYTLDAIVERVREFDKNNPPKPGQKGLIGTELRLERVPSAFDDIIALLYNIRRGESFETGKAVLARIKDEINAGRYVLLAYGKKIWSDDKEPGPLWHAVVVFGYDGRDVLVADSNGPQLLALNLKPEDYYYMTSQAPDTWDEATKSWIDEPTRLRKEQEK